MSDKEALGVCDCGHKSIHRTGLGSFPFRGRVRIEQFRDGQLVEIRCLPNLVVNDGKAEAAGLLGGLAGFVGFKYIAWGTGVTPPDPEDPGLEVEIVTGGLERKLGDVSSDANVLSVQATATVTGAGPYAVTEVGLFNDAAAGEMFARLTFAALNLVQNDVLTYTWEVTCG